MGIYVPMQYAYLVKYRFNRTRINYMRCFSLLSVIPLAALMMILIAIPVGASQGYTPGYDLEFSQFLQEQGANVQPSVVSIETRFTRMIHDTNGLLREVTVSGGYSTGFIYNRDGVVVTDYTSIIHPPSTYFAITSGQSESVADYIKVMLSDGRTYEAEIVGTDGATSLAVLRMINIEPVDSIPIPIGNSDDVLIGEPILFLGYNYLSMERITYDFGVISALRPEIQSVEQSTNQFLQVNVPQNWGNQGGVVVNTLGKVIAVMTTYVPYSDATEIHFALPVKTMVEVVDAILDEGEMHRPWVGYRLLEMSPQIERAYQIIGDLTGDGLVTDADRDIFMEDTGIDLREALFVIYVSEDSPAADIGLKEGDILTKFNGVPVPTMDELTNEVEKYRIGDTITLEWMRREYTVWDPYVADTVIEYFGQRDAPADSE